MSITPPLDKDYTQRDDIDIHSSPLHIDIDLESAHEIDQDRKLNLVNNEAVSPIHPPKRRRLDPANALPTPQDEKDLVEMALQSQSRKASIDMEPSDSASISISKPPSISSSRRGSLALQDTVPTEILETLRRHPLLQASDETGTGLDSESCQERSDDFISDVIKNLNPVSYNVGDHIIVQGETAKAMFFLLRGNVTIASRDGESTYAEVQAGSFFGEISILFGRPRTASVIAKTRCLCVSLTKEGLESVLPKYPAIEDRLKRQAQERLRILDTLQQSSEQDLSESTAHRVLSNLDIRQQVAKVPAFRQLPDEFVHLLCMSVEYRCFPPYTYIIRQDDIGDECFFITSGTVEVVRERKNKSEGLNQPQEILAKLDHGNFFGEMALLKKMRRSASVRTISQVDCLLLKKERMLKLIQQYPEVGDELRRVADLRDKLNQKTSVETVAVDIIPPLGDTQAQAISEPNISPSISSASENEAKPFMIVVPADPDPLQPHILMPAPASPMQSDEVAARQRSLKRRASAISIRTDNVEDIEMAAVAAHSPLSVTSKQARLDSLEQQVYAPLSLDVSMAASAPASKRLRDQDLARIFYHIGDVVELMRLRVVCKRWATILSTHPGLIQSIDLTKRTRQVDDWALGYIARFGNKRIRAANLKGCFHVTDMGFGALVRESPMLESLSINSCWEISADLIGQIPLYCARLRYIDVGNCRKVNDLAMAHLVVGCPMLTHFELSYCKSLTDHTLALLAKYAAHRLEHLSLHRLTTITSAGFESWLYTRFPRLQTLILSDCSYLNDHVVLAICSSCRGASVVPPVPVPPSTETEGKGASVVARTSPPAPPLKISPPLISTSLPPSSLRALNLSFCCSLTDAALEHLTSRCTNLDYLNVAFCGSAVSDTGLVKISQRLKNLKEVVVRGCVRVTDSGIAALVKVCPLDDKKQGNLRVINATQCRNVDKATWDVQGMKSRGVYLLL